MEKRTILIPGVTAQWNVMSGTPVIAGRRLPTIMIAGMFSEGRTCASIAELYGLKVEQVEAAIRYEYQRRKNRHPEYRAERPIRNKKPAPPTSK